MRTHLRLLALASVGVIALAGCGSSHPAAAPTTSLPGQSMTPGMVMPNGSTMGAEATTSATSAAPSAATQMVCAAETRANITTILGLQGAPTTTSTWAAGVYTCTYLLPMGTLILSVNQSANPTAAGTYFAGLRATLGPTQTLNGLGQGAYGTADGTVVLIKDSDTLRVDATQLPAVLGAQHSKRFDFAYELASDILGCWTGG